MNIMIEDFTVNIPDDYRQVRSQPGDPAGSISYYKETPNAACLAMYNAITAAQAMPFNSVEEVIKGIHGTLAPDQGLIEAEAGVTNNGKKYLYTIVKTLNRSEQGVQYTVIVHMGYYADKVFQVQGFFEETGFTGNRDTAVFAIYAKEGKVTATMEGWTKDPYDENYAQGMLMNMSEKRDYDDAFPDHPLTQARQLIANLIESN